MGQPRGGIGRGIAQHGSVWSSLAHVYRREAELAAVAERFSSHSTGQLAAIGWYSKDLARKYERAARYPWLPVPTDPPLPEWTKANGGRACVGQAAEP